MLFGKDLAEGVTGCLNQRMDVLPWISWYSVLTPNPSQTCQGLCVLLSRDAPKPPGRGKPPAPKASCREGSGVWNDLAAKAWEGKRQ